MTNVTQPLRDEHRELLPQLERLREAAEAVHTGLDDDARRKVEAALEFLQGHLIPHAEAEDSALYPVVGRVMGAPDATKTMRRDHVEVGRLTEELAASLPGMEAAGPERQVRLERLLYGLYALVGVHFAKEEEIYLPLLDAHLGADEARTMFEAMERAAAEAKRDQGGR